LRVVEVPWEPLQKADLCPPGGAGGRAGGSQARLEEWCLEVLCLEEEWLVLVVWEACKGEELAGEKMV